MERLARRCGYDAVAAAMPQGDKRLLSHIQKEMVRKKRTQRAGSQVRHKPAGAAMPGVRLDGLPHMYEDVKGHGARELFTRFLLACSSTC